MWHLTTLDHLDGNIWNSAASNLVFCLNSQNVKKSNNQGAYDALTDSYPAGCKTAEEVAVRKAANWRAAQDAMAVSEAWREELGCQCRGPGKTPLHQGAVGNKNRNRLRVLRGLRRSAGGPPTGVSFMKLRCAQDRVLTQFTVDSDDSAWMHLLISCVHSPAPLPPPAQASPADRTQACAAKRLRGLRAGPHRERTRG